MYLEVGDKKVFAGAVEWPGWTRAGRDEASALRALIECGPRYAKVASAVERSFTAPSAPELLNVSERLAGNATTDFGAPGGIPAADERPLDDRELGRLEALLEACWQAFNTAAEAAAGRDLRPGARGGGRSLAKVREHVIGAERSYAGSVGATGLGTTWPEIQAGLIEAIRARAHGELPETGPRGGRRWPARYAVRRAAWHVLDHAWEIEDRSTSQG